MEQPGSVRHAAARLAAGAKTRALAIATTPRPVPLIKRLLVDPTVAVVRGSTYENRANLAPSFFDGIVDRYEGTALGRQELLGEVMDEDAGSLFKRGLIDAARVSEAPPLRRIVVAIDPAVTARATSDETGIIAAGVGFDGEAYVLEDASLKASPDGWARAAVEAYQRWEADRIVAEVNNGGDLVEHTVRTVDANVPFTAVRASRGKVARAEPVAALYEQGKVHHVGVFERFGAPDVRGDGEIAGSGGCAGVGDQRADAGGRGRGDHAAGAGKRLKATSPPNPLSTA